MENKIQFKVFLALPIIVLGLWTLSLAWKAETGQEVIITAHGYDPRNLISGHYLNLELDWSKTDCNQFIGKQCPQEKFDRIYNFYIPEKDAKYLDRVVSAWNIDNVKTELVFSYPSEGMPILKNMLLDGVDWDVWVKNNPQ